MVTLQDQPFPLPPTPSLCQTCFPALLWSSCRSDRVVEEETRKRDGRIEGDRDVTEQPGGPVCVRESDLGVHMDLEYMSCKQCLNV